MQFAILMTLAACAASYGFTWIARRYAPLLGWVDHPDGARKLHERPIPLMGGLAVYASVMTIFAVSWIGWQSLRGQSDLWGCLVGAGCFCMLGLWDDRWPLRARTKLAGQCLATIPFLMICGPITNVTGGGLSIGLGPLAIPFTMFWIVTCVNVVNFLDGLDGLAGLIGLIAMTTLAAVGAMGGHYEVSFVCLLVAGALAGFLCHNWPPATIFLGDAGSMLIGSLIGFLAISGSLKTPAGFTLMTPLLVLSVPIFDTLMAIIRRQLRGQSIGTADRGHIHHRLQDHGFTRLQSLVVIAGLCVLTSLAAVLACGLHRESLGAVMCVCVLALVIISGMFGDREMMMVLRHVWALAGLIPQAGRALGARFLLAKLRHADAPQRDRILEALSERFRAAGCRQLGFQSAETIPSELPSARWPRLALVKQPLVDVKWEVSYQIEKPNGARIKVTALGTYDAESPGDRLEDVFRLLDEVCRYWPDEDLARLTWMLMSPALRVDVTDANDPHHTTVRAA